MCVTALIGAAIGGGIGYGAQVIANLNNGLSVDQALTRVEGSKIVAVAGAIGGATFGIGTAVLGTGVGAGIVSGALAGGLSGQAEIATANVLEGRDIRNGLGNIADIATDATIGGILGGTGNKIGTVLRSAVSNKGGTVSLFRAVSTAEFQDISNIKGFRPAPGSMETKLFATSADDAAKFGRMLYGDTPFKIVQVDVPESVAGALYSFETDGMPTIAVDPDQLDQFNQVVDIILNP